jgi:hypothetical protein
VVAPKRFGEARRVALEPGLGDGRAAQQALEAQLGHQELGEEAAVPPGGRLSEDGRRGGGEGATLAPGATKLLAQERHVGALHGTLHPFEGDPAQVRAPRRHPLVQLPDRLRDRRVVGVEEHGPPRG